MDRKAIRQRLYTLLKPLCAAREVSIWGVDLLFGTEGRRGLVRIYLDAPQGVQIEDCTVISRGLGLALDVENCIPGAYTLEVSSPGLDRPFFHLKQMEDYIGQTVRIRLHTARQGRKNYKGKLCGLSAPEFTLDVDGTTHTLSWSDVSKANIVAEFSEPTKPGKDRRTQSPS